MSDFVKSSALLTEHLGYAPIALIDDVINAVNEILYQCTAAMETFLIERYGQDESIPEDEIELGTAKLETLLETAVDRCFDMFELYVLRNLLVIPADLISEGWMRLEHHEGVDFDTTRDESERLATLRRELYEQKHLNSLLKIRSKRGSKLLSVLESYKESLKFLKTKDAADVAPLNETVQFLSVQVTEMMARVDKLHDIKYTSMVPRSRSGDSRDIYIDRFAKRAIENAGLESESTEVTPEQAARVQQYASTCTIN